MSPVAEANLCGSKLHCVSALAVPEQKRDYQMQEYAVLWLPDTPPDAIEQALAVAASSMSEALDKAAEELGPQANITAVIGPGAKGVRLDPKVQRYL